MRVTTAKDGRRITAQSSCASFKAAARTSRVDCLPIQMNTATQSETK